MANRVWSDLECFLAIWVYYKLETNSSIIKTHLYEEVSEIIGRKASAIELKVRNVSACDSRPREEKPISEMKNYQKRLKELFDELWGRPEEIEKRYNLYIERNFFNLAKQGFDIERIDDAVSKKSNFYVEEGELKHVKRTTRTRSTKLVKLARKYYRKDDGNLYCEVCGFSELNVIGANVIQIHHLEPLAELEYGIEVPIEEAIVKVRPVCPTCHTIIHSKKPLLSLAEARELRQLISQKIAEL